MHVRRTLMAIAVCASLFGTVSVAAPVSADPGGDPNEHQIGDILWCQRWAPHAYIACLDALINR